MNFSEALIYLKAGKRIKRKDKVIWLYLDKYNQIRELDFNFGFPDSTLWEPSHEDILADDWEVQDKA